MSRILLFCSLGDTKHWLMAAVDVESDVAFISSYCMGMRSHGYRLIVSRMTELGMVRIPLGILDGSVR